MPSFDNPHIEAFSYLFADMAWFKISKLLVLKFFFKNLKKMQGHGKAVMLFKFTQTKVRSLFTIFTNKFFQACNLVRPHKLHWNFDKKLDLS